MKSKKTPSVKPGSTRQLTLSNHDVAWHFDWSDGSLRCSGFDNHLSGLRFNLSGVQELTLVFSAAADRLAEPLQRVGDFVVRSVRQVRSNRAEFELRSPALIADVRLHIQLNGPTRRKWVDVRNTSKSECLLLDVELDDFTTEATVSGGGNDKSVSFPCAELGKPVFIENEVFAAIEHPSGDNRGACGRVRLAHFPGRRLTPGGRFHSHVAIVSVAAAGQAIAHFTSYIQAKSLAGQKPRMISVYTPFGINSQWGANPTLDDEQTLDVLELLKKLRKKGATFDYFTLDAGWVDFSSDLTKFKPTSYPNGPAKVIARVKQLGMKFGLWFGTNLRRLSCWDYAGAFPDGKPPAQPYREGYPWVHFDPRFCLLEDNYFSILKKAVLHHVRENNVRFLKFDDGIYVCDHTEHGHLPGKYSTEAMHEKLIDIANSARAIAPDVFVMWYWGLSSPFWLMHGDSLFYSGLTMEGSATSAIPTLYYRDSVNLALDQNAQFAKTIPAVLKDSLGVWMANTCWGNYMGKERWRESLVMDLGRGSRLFPNIWGNLYDLTDDDVKFLGWITQFAKKNAAYFQNRKIILGDPFRNEVYGYAHGRGSRSFVFVNNVHFISRPATLRLDASLGLDARPGTAVGIVSHFPERKQVRCPKGEGFRLGDTLELWLRPFETLMLEVAPTARAARLPVRDITSAYAADLGTALVLQTAELDGGMEVSFLDAEVFAQKKFEKKVYAFKSAFPSLEGDQPILAIAVCLRKDGAEWKYVPTVVQIVQALLRVGKQNVQLIPVPEGRQHGSTQSYGSSWVLWKVRLNPEWSKDPFKIAVHANLPADVEAHVEAWVVKRWWKENTRPTHDGYYTYAPS